tara:strand:+ start:1908 stop:2027 length:120 start_codon:yes stop_codon:yes gene_type:complete
MLLLSVIRSYSVPLASDGSLSGGAVRCLLRVNKAKIKQT